MNVHQSIKLANEHYRLGDLPKAEQLCQEMLSRDSQCVQAIYLLGLIAYRKSRLDLALVHFRRVIDLRPSMAEAHNSLANGLRSKGLIQEAIAAYQRAVGLKEDFAEAFYNLGTALRETDCVEEAVKAFRKSLALQPESADAANDLGSALRETGQIEEAEAVLRQTVQRWPQFFKAHNNLGNALRMLGQFDEAERAVRAALKLRPDIAEIHINLGNVLREKGDIDGAVAATRGALRLRPDMADAHQNLGSHLLLAGRYLEAWPEHEWRWRCQGMTPWRAATLRPQWDGSNLHGRTILLYSDAGLGDAIHCLRYVPLIADRGGRIVVECPEGLHRLVGRLKGVEQIFTEADPLPSSDVQCALMSLPGAFGTTLESIPSRFPYLPVDESLAERWRKQLSNYPHPRVGLAWAGNPKNTVDRRRSMRLAMLAPLAEAGKITFHSLQMGEAAKQITQSPQGLEVVDHSRDLGDFAETAALVQNLDLVISVDTSVAHLAGALGKPIWTMLPYVPDWRWMLNREDSPWYPTMRLFRQTSVGDWPGVVRRIANSLADFLDKR